MRAKVKTLSSVKNSQPMVKPKVGSFFTVQAKLNVSRPGDSCEAEADRVSNIVVSQQNPVPVIPGISGSVVGTARAHSSINPQNENLYASSEEDDESVSASSEVDEESVSASSNEDEESVSASSEDDEESVSAYSKNNKFKRSYSGTTLNRGLKDSKGGGESLSSSARNFMEPRFGFDFSSVKIHSDSKANIMAKSINAKAFTHGKDIYFGSGQFNPHTVTGKKLLAHELTHTIQQNGEGVKRKVFGDGESVSINSKETRSDNSLFLYRKVAAEEVSTTEADIPVEENAAPVNDAAEVNNIVETDESSNSVKSKKLEKSKKDKDKEKEKKEESETEFLSKVKKGISFGQDPKGKALVERIDSAATEEKTMRPSNDMVNEAQAAAKTPANDQKSRAQINQVKTMEKQKAEKPKTDTFLEALRKQLKKIAPKTLEQMDEFKSNGKAKELKSKIKSEVGTTTSSATKGIKGATDAVADPNSVEKRVEGPAPVPITLGDKKVVDAKKASPQKRKEEDVSLQKNKDFIDKKLEEEELTDERLTEANDERFTAVQKNRDDVHAHADKAPKEYRSKEKGVLGVAKKQMGLNEAKEMEIMHLGRGKSIKLSTDDQTNTKSKDEIKRQKVADDIEKKFGLIQKNVRKKLSGLDTIVDDIFTKGEKKAREKFEDTVKTKMDDYKRERYSGVIGKGKWLKDKVFSLPDYVNTFYEDGRDQYVKDLDKVIKDIATSVETGLAEAKKIIENGKKDIKEYVDGLDKDLTKYGQEALTALDDKFNTLTEEVDEKKNELVRSVADKYNNAQKDLDKRIEKLKEANKGLVDKAVDAVKGVAKFLLEVKKKMEKIFAKAKSAVSIIIKNPIKFLGNLLDAVKLGFKKFVKNIWTHIKAGIMSWLFGKVGEMGITLPKDFSIKSIFGLVMQILGLTKDNILARVRKVIGNKAADAIGHVIEIVSTLIKDGPGGLWKMMKKWVGDVKTFIIDAIKEWIITKIITAAVTKLVSMFNPAGAIVQAVLTIYNVVEFFIANINRILDLVNAILDSILSIAQGKIAKASDWIEKVMAKMVPILISFLANLLGLGGITKKIQTIIQRIQGKINMALDKVIKKIWEKAKKFAGKLFGKGKAVAKKFTKWWQSRKKFKTKSGKKHDLYFKGGEKTLVPWVASENPMPVDKRLMQWSSKANAANAPKKFVDAKSKISEATTLNTKVQTAARSQKNDTDSARLTVLLADLFDIFGLDIEESGEPVKVGDATAHPKVTYKTKNLTLGSVSGMVGSHMIAEQLTPNHGQGSDPIDQTGLLEKLPTKGKVDSGVRTGNNIYIRGHLLNDNVGGPGKAKNMFPITSQANTDHKNIESELKDMVNKKHYVVYYSVQVSSASKGTRIPGSALYKIDSTFNCVLDTYKKHGSKLLRQNKPKTASVRSGYIVGGGGTSGSVSGNFMAGSVSVQGFDPAKVKWAPSYYRRRLAEVGFTDAAKEKLAGYTTAGTFVTKLTAIHGVGNTLAEYAAKVLNDPTAKAAQITRVVNIINKHFEEQAS